MSHAGPPYFWWIEPVPAFAELTTTTSRYNLHVVRIIPLVPGAEPQERPNKPAWLKVRAPGSPSYLRLKSLMRELKLHTVCEDAHCPNIGECWNHGTATF
jgi:lipoate synthase